MDTEFKPQDKIEIRKLFPEIELISSDEIKEGVTKVWIKAWRGGGWDRVEHAPLMIRDIHDPSVGVQHIRVSVKLALAIAEILELEMGQTLNRDYLIAGALLHDVGKALEYAPRGQGPLTGSALRHSVSGAHFVLEVGLPMEIAHIVATHSKEGVLYDKSLEAEVVSRAELLAWEVTCRQKFGIPGSRYVEGAPVTKG